MPPGGGDSPSSGATITSVFFLMTIFGIWLAVAHAIYTANFELSRATLADRVRLARISHTI